MKAANLVSRMVQLAEGEVGVVEVPKNSNKGKRVQEYQKATWLEGTGWPWCAAFICWLIFKAIESGISVSFSRPQTAGAWDFESWARKQKGKGVVLLTSGEVKRGDIVVFKFSHIGFAVGDEDDDLIRTIEGNTDKAGSREGGGVYRKVRKKSEIRSWIRFVDVA
jgi:hypothetical protein